MRNPMRLLIFLLYIISSQVLAVEQDKKKHFAASAIISGVTQHVWQDWRISTAVCMSVGLAKELTDDYVDKNDLAYDLAGCAFGVLAYKASDYIINITPQQDGAIVNFSGSF